MPWADTSPWADERREARLRELHAAGYSFGHITDRLCIEFDWNVTRNSVIGKATRIGLEKRRGAFSSPTATPVASKVKAIRRQRLTEYVSIVPPEPQPDHSAPVTLLELHDHHCRWPHEQPGQPMMYCGAYALEGLPYCAPHCRIAYRLPDSGRRAA